MNFKYILTTSNFFQEGPCGRVSHAKGFVEGLADNHQYVTLVSGAGSKNFIKENTYITFKQIHKFYLFYFILELYRSIVKKETIIIRWRPFLPFVFIYFAVFYRNIYFELNSVTGLDSKNLLIRKIVLFSLRVSVRVFKIIVVSEVSKQQILSLVNKYRSIYVMPNGFSAEGLASFKSEHHVNAFPNLVYFGRISRLVYQGNNDFISPLALSYASVINFLIGWLYFKEYENKKIYLNFVVLIMLFLSIPMFILGASRGSFISGFLLVFYILAFSNIRTKILSLIIIPIFVYALYYITVLTGSNAFDRFLGIKDAVDNNESSAARLEMWSTGLSYFYNSPIYGGYLEVGGIYPHDIFVEILMNTGIFGFLSLFIPVFVLFIFSVRYTVVEKHFLFHLFL